MFLSSRFLRSVLYQPNSTTASLLINALMKPVCLGRFRPMILLFNRPNIPSILGISSTRQSHSLGTGGRRHSSSTAGGKKGGGIQKGNDDQFGKGAAGNGRGGDGKSVSGESKDGSYQTVSPATIQVETYQFHVFSVMGFLTTSSVQTGALSDHFFHEGGRMSD